MLRIKKNIVLLLTALLVFFDAYGDANTTSSSQTMLGSARLTCISEALKKMNKPIDDNYLALLGLIVREKAILVDSIDSPSNKKTTRRSDFDSPDIKETKNGPVYFSGAMNYQMNVIRMLTSAGYCTPGKIKSRNESAKYENYMERIQSVNSVAGNIFTDPRNAALKEVGVSASWGNVLQELFIDKDSQNKKDLFTMSHTERSAFYANKRRSVLNRGRDYIGSSSDLGIKDCFEDIQNNFESSFSKSEEAYKLCDAIYYECGIATNLPERDERGELFRPLQENGKTYMVRVGGDWCAKEFGGRPADYLSKNAPPNTLVVKKAADSKPAAKNNLPPAPLNIPVAPK
ncbi:MAG: hypothetical protein JNL11_10295 [Bdellovibrionaceae bacterium]|nr:hypothetical protein [Pseudobdellovibrionaceae bacterium]